MSSSDILRINCQSCTVINEIVLSHIGNDLFCHVCSNKLELPDVETMTHIIEANKKEEVINDNYRKAYEEIPTSFIPATMIFLNAKIEGNDIRFLVDTGAQVSLLPLYIVKLCNLDHLLDQRVAGELKGVGKDRIMGRIYYLEVELPCGIIPCSFTVCENDSIEPILGIDMMQHMGLMLDFKNRKIKINEHELPM